MKIYCNAEYYDYKVEDNKVFFYNKLYNSKTVILFLTAIIEAILPDINGFNLPLAVEAEIGNNNISLGKKLELFGTEKYSYFIPYEHYCKWKKTYAFIYLCMILAEILVSAIVLYIFIGPSGLNPLVGLVLVLLAFVVGILVFKFVKQLKMVSKYQIKHKTFN